MNTSERDYSGLTPETLYIKDQIKGEFLFYSTDIIINLDTKNIRGVVDCVNLDIFTRQDQEAYVKLHWSSYEGKFARMNGDKNEAEL